MNPIAALRRIGAKLRLYASMLNYGLQNSHGFALEHAEFYQRFLEWYGPVAGKRVVEIGCGKMYWLSLLLHTDGAVVTGFDTELPQPGRHLSKYLGIARKNGLERAARTLVWDWLFAGRYYRALGQATARQLRHDGVDLRTVDRYRELADESVDLVISHEVFEHIADVAATVDEVVRMLKPTGTTYIYIHNFTSLSGGHHIAWKFPDTRPSIEVPPWDHLRDKKYPDIPSWLNEYRESHYRGFFSSRMDILDWRYTPQEGRRLLTDALRRELAAYTGHELLTKGFTVIARKRSS